MSTSNIVPLSSPVGETPHLQTPPSKDLPPIKDAADFVTHRIPPPYELVHNLIHASTKVALGGGSKSMKTWTQLLLAICVSHGIPFLGRTTKQGKVLVVNLEVPDWAIQDRLKHLAAALGVEFALGKLDIWNLRGFAADHNLLIPKITERVKEGYALVVIDPIYKIYGDLDENSAGDVALLLNSIERLAVDSGAAIVFAAHFSKGNQSAKESIDRISGSGVFARDPDTLLIFTRHEEADCFTVEPTLRNFPPIEPFVVRWDYPLMKLDETLDPLKLKKTGGRVKKFTIEHLAEVLGEVPCSTSALEELVTTKHKMSHSTFFRLLNDLDMHPQVGKNREGLWCRQK